MVSCELRLLKLSVFLVSLEVSIPLNPPDSRGTLNYLFPSLSRGTLNYLIPPFLRGVRGDRIAHFQTQL